MRGIPIPDQEADFTADPSELYFDLAFVFAFSRLVFHLVHHPDWTGVGEFVLLFTMIWLPWSQFTWSANAVAGNSRTVRFLFMVATVVSIPMAGSVNAAFGAGAPAFAISLAIILVIGLLMIVTADSGDAVTDTGLTESSLRWAVPNFVAIAIMIGGGFLDGRARVIAWVVAMLVVLWGTIQAGQGDWVTRAGHFAERHGLIIIVALGEVIVAVAVPVVDALAEEDAGLPGRTIVVLGAAGAFAGLLWWGYFDRPNPAIEHRHNEMTNGQEGGRFARDVYTYSHLPLVAGIILAAAALEEITLHPDDVLPEPFRWMLFAGLTCYLLAVVIFIYRAYGIVARERLATIAALLVLTLVAGSLDGLVVLIVVDLLLLGMLMAEHVRVEGGLRIRATATAG